VQPLLPRPDRPGSLPEEMGNAAGRLRPGVVRGCPLGTGHDRCEWHGGGTAPRTTLVKPAAAGVHLDHRVRAVPGNHCCMGKPLQTARQLLPVPSGRGRLRRSGPPPPGTGSGGHGKADHGLVNGGKLVMGRIGSVGKALALCSLISSYTSELPYRQRP
jgi:hypothetical protein